MKHNLFCFTRAAMNRICKALVLGILCIGILSAPALTQADPVTDNFNGLLLQGNYVTGDGSGYQGGTFFQYPDPAGGPDWWNQWFFNSPDILGSKWIEYDIWFEPLGPPQEIEVAINWSNELWTDPTTPPLPGFNDYIVRETIYTGPGSGTIDNLGNPLWIPDFNPVWVSIDIRAVGPPVSEVSFGGTIVHEHVGSPPVPEPTTLFLFGFGLLGIAAAGRKKY